MSSNHDTTPLAELSRDIYASVAVIVFVLAVAAIVNVLYQMIR
jgi:hypothetical protein